MSSMILRTSLLVASLGGLLFPQDFQNAFTEVRFDKAKSPATFHAGAKVDVATGALTYDLPLGPGIGARGVTFVPTLRNHISPQTKHPQQYVPTRLYPSTSTYHPGGISCSLTPGYYAIDTGLAVGIANEEFLLPSGAVGTMSPQNQTSLANATAVMQSFGIQGAVSQTGVGTQGELVIHLTGGEYPGNRLPYWMPSLQDPVQDDEWFTYPGGILMVTPEGVATLFVYVHPQYEKGGAGSTAQRTDNGHRTQAPEPTGGRNYLRMVHYLPVLIRNRFGDEISIDPKGTSLNGLDFTATWSRNGTTKASVQVFHQGIGVNVPTDLPLINGFDGSRTTVRAQVQYSESSTPSFKVDFIPLMMYPLSSRPWGQSTKAAWDEIRRSFQPIQVALDQTGETVSFSYQPALPLVFPSYVPATLESITLPGRKISFTWEEYIYRRGSNVPNKYFELVDPTLDLQCNDLWHGAAVTQIREQDLTGHSGTRTTSYSRTLPVPDPAHNNGPFWSSTTFFTCVTHPDGRRVDHYFAGPQPGVYGVEDVPGQIIKITGARKQLLLSTHEYKPGEGWSVDTIYGGGGFSGVNDWINPYWNCASLQNPDGRLYGVPYPTHIQTTTQGGGTSVQKVQSQSGWDAVNAGWQVSNTEAGGLTRRVDRTFEFRANAWQGPLVKTEAATGQPPKAMDYNPDGTLNTDNRASGQQVLGRSYGNGLPQPSAVSLTGSAGSGSAGASYAYDGYGHLSRIQLDGLPYAVSQANDAFGRPLSQTDGNGITVQIEWDSAGRLQAIRPPGGELPTTYSYPSSFQVVATRGLGTTTYTYDGFGQLVSMTKPSGHSKTFSYDAAGRRTFESVWGAAAGTSTDYDGLGRPTRIQDPNNLVTTISHGALSRTVTVGDATTGFGYDALHRLNSLVDALGNLTTYSYDDGDRITGVVQQGGGMSQSRGWTYNGLGWLTSLTQPESGTTSYSNFSILGKPQTTDYNGRTVSTGYDAIGRIQSVSGSGVDQAFSWDGGSPGNGKLQSSRDGNIVLTFGYGGLNGRLGSLTTSLLDSIQGTPIAPFPQTFVYNSYGHRISATLPSGRTVTYDWDDARDVPSGVKAQGGRPGSWGAVSAMATVTTFNPADNPFGLTFANAASTAFTYSADQLRLDSMIHAKNGVNAFSKTWTYNWAHPRQLLLGDGDDSYTYDALGRLETATFKLLGDPASITQSFSYDPFGNQVSSAVDLNVLPLGLQKNFANFTFAPNAFVGTNQLPGATASGALTGATYDLQGNLTGIFKAVGDVNRSLNMTYDALGRVTSMFDNERGVTEKYFYTAEGLRTRIETWQGGVLQKVTIKLYNDQRQLVSEYEAVAPGAPAGTAPRVGKASSTAARNLVSASK